MAKKKYNFMAQAESLSDVEIKDGFLEKFKAPEKDEMKMINFPFIMDDGSIPVKTIEFFEYNYQAKGKNRQFGKFERPEDPELLERALNLIGHTKTRSVTVILELTTRVKGRGADSKIIVSDMKPICLVLDNGKIKQLKTLVNNFDLNTHDIMVTSDNPRYQKMTFQAKPGEVDNLPGFMTAAGFDEEDVEDVLDDCDDLFTKCEQCLVMPMDNARITHVLDEIEEFGLLGSDFGDSKSKDNFDEDDDEEEEEAPRKKRAKRKSKQRDDEFDEDDDDEEIGFAEPDDLEEEPVDVDIVDDEEPIRKPRRRR